jgi:hypothetical protein
MIVSVVIVIIVVPKAANEIPDQTAADSTAEIVSINGSIEPYAEIFIEYSCNIIIGAIPAVVVPVILCATNAISPFAAVILGSANIRPSAASSQKPCNIIVRKEHMLFPPLFF